MKRLLLVLGIVLLAMGTPASAQKQIMDLNDAMRTFKSTNANDRAAALALVAYMGGDAKIASKDVVGLMFDNSPFVRQWANTALGKINPELAEPVLEMVNGKDNDARIEAMQKLVAMGPDLAGPALTAVMKFFSQVDESDRPKVVNALAQLGGKDPAVATMLANVGLRDKDPAVRQAALTALPKMADAQAALPIFENLLKNSDPAERAQAVTGLAAMAAKYPQAMKSLQAATADPSPTVSGAAKQAVAKVKQEKK